MVAVRVAGGGWPAPGCPLPETVSERRTVVSILSAAAHGARVTRDSSRHVTVTRVS